MKPKRFIIPVILIAALVSGCEKYDGGGSVGKADKTITENLWEIQSATDLEEGVDITADYAGEIWEFTSGMQFNINSSLEGTYAFSDDKLTLIITDTGGSVDSYRIERLDKDGMWLVKLGEEELKFVPY